MQQTGLNQRFEVSIQPQRSYQNPFDEDEVKVEGFFTAPNGTTVTQPGFWYVGYTRALVEGVEILTPTGEACFKVRFAPDQLGSWQYHTVLTDGEGQTRYPAEGEEALQVLESANKGCLRVYQPDPAHLEFGDGSPYAGIGHNLCGWEWGGTDNREGTFEYDRWFERMAANGANLAQFDFCEGDQIEWTPHPDELPFSADWGGLGWFNPQTAWKMDTRFEKAEELGFYFRLTLSHWEDFDNETDPIFPDWGWNRNPYNTANGGPAANVTEFFTLPAAKSAYKNYMRYVVARWGYSTNILAVELWNEVDSPDIIWGEGQSYATAREAIRGWHAEMAAYLKEIDGGRHLVTTSYADSAQDNAVWQQADIDITTIHRYTLYNPYYAHGFAEFETEDTIAYLIQDRYEAVKKPVMIGEFALSPGGDIQKEQDSTGIAFHNQLWASVLQKAMGTAMHWTWGSYIDAYDLYYHYKPLAAFLAGEDLRETYTTREGYGDFRAYGLRRSNAAFLWLQNIYSTFIDREVPKTPLTGKTINVTDIYNGRYAVVFYNTYTGDIVEQTEMIAQNHTLTLPVPTFEKDIAVKLHCLEDIQNLVVNGGFEDDGPSPRPIGWQTWPGNAGTDEDAFFSEAVTPHTGRYRGTHYKPVPYEAFTFQAIENLDNGLYTYSAWIISSEDNFVNFIAARAYGGEEIQQPVPQTFVWTKVTISDIPVTNGRCEIGFYSYEQGGSWLGIDDVEFYKQPE